MRVRAYLGLGSNLGDRWEHLRAAVAALGDPDAAWARRLAVGAVSPVYESEPVGGPGGQGPYLNAVVGVDTDLTPRELLGVAGALEARAGRVRTERWGPRTLDVDILTIGDPAAGGVVIDEEDLVVPHPRIAERPFVTVPLADLDPGLAGKLRAMGEEFRGVIAGEVRKVGNL